MHGYRGRTIADARLALPRRVVQHRVEHDPGPLEVGEGAGAHPGHVLAYAAAEHDAIAPPEHGEVSADVLADPIAVEVDRKLRLWRGIGHQPPGVGVAAGEAGKSRFAVEQLDHLVRGP